MKKNARPAKRAKPAKPRIRLAVDDRRAQLLALGIEAFSGRPYDAVSVDGIAARAGISRGLLFHYFPSKRDFFVAVIEVMAERMLAQSFPAQPPGVMQPVELVSMLSTGLDAYFAFVEEHADVFATLLRAGGEEGAQEVVEAVRREIVTRMASYLPEPPERDAPALRAALYAWDRFVEGVALDWIEHRDLSRTERVQLAMRAAMLLPGGLFAPPVVGAAQVAESAPVAGAAPARVRARAARR